MNAPNNPSPLSYRIVRAMRTSGRNGYPAVWYVFEVHVRRVSPIEPLRPLLRKDGTPRMFKSREGARAAIRRLRAAE